MVALLLAEDGIRLDLEDDGGSTPLMLARSREDIGMVRLPEQRLMDASQEKGAALAEGAERDDVSPPHDISLLDKKSETHHTTPDVKPPHPPWTTAVLYECWQSRSFWLRCPLLFALLSPIAAVASFSQFFFFFAVSCCCLLFILVWVVGRVSRRGPGA
ncbi:hypothetical protein SERLA73DRAFT_173401 [Serpula lacrymans var. lacrymans S7.3]|uniref:Uncharacterized protein n=1 Tax=Serpula lacrymans var. lacrymans (strain S7.3) TaxID=936435 RepID=F8QJ23_SERL3|nr:hypothetical protein SERLA73DRAFT_173401 [Serpula lacrymans var. lacrymans S7.3]